jgi:hypothetical protein
MEHVALDRTVEVQLTELSMFGLLARTEVSPYMVTVMVMVTDNLSKWHRLTPSGRSERVFGPFFKYQGPLRARLGLKDRKN